MRERGGEGDKKGRDLSTDSPRCCPDQCFPSFRAGVKKGFLESVGNTPLIRLNKLSDETGCEILAKAEFMNPG